MGRPACVEQHGTSVLSGCCRGGWVPVELVEHGRDPPNPVDDLLPLVGADLVDEAIRGGPTVAQRTTMHHAAQASGEEGAPERASVCVRVCV